MSILSTDIILSGCGYINKYVAKPIRVQKYPCEKLLKSISLSRHQTVGYNTLG